jgi:hypothetical protein
LSNRRGQGVGAGEAATAVAIGADEVGIAKRTLGGLSVALQPGP